MGRVVKNKYIGGRVTREVFDTVTVYHNASDMTQGDLVRAAVDEYMINHPLKEGGKPPATLVDFPGVLDGTEATITTTT